MATPPTSPQPEPDPIRSELDITAEPDPLADPHADVTTPSHEVVSDRARGPQPHEVNLPEVPVPGSRSDLGMDPASEDLWEQARAADRSAESDRVGLELNFGGLRIWLGMVMGRLGPVITAPIGMLILAVALAVITLAEVPTWGLAVWAALCVGVIALAFRNHQQRGAHGDHDPRDDGDGDPRRRRRGRGRGEGPRGA